MSEHSPSMRARVNNLVQAYARRAGKKPGLVWKELYDEYESRTNVPWRKLAYNNGTAPMVAMQALRRLEAFLELARELYAPQNDPEDLQ